MTANPAFAIASIVVAAVYLAQLAVKFALASRYSERCRRKKNADEQARAKTPEARETPPPVSFLQPVVSGDPALAATLQSNLETFRGHDARFFWLADEGDKAALSICEVLAEKFPTISIEILRIPPPPQGVNPKARKLAAAFGQITTPFFVVLDDDTRLSAAGLRALLDGLDAGASLATGLPRYHGEGGCWSACLAEFVNSSAALTYLPALVFSEPVSINGMCYAMRTGEARRLDVFRAIERHLTDDLAVALLLQRNRLRIHQTVEPHDIATTVPKLRPLLRLMHRWFVFARLLLAAQGAGARLGIAVCYGLPPLLIWAAIVLACFSPWSAALLAVCAAGREIMLRLVARKFIGAKTAGERSMAASIGQELAQPVFLAAAFLNKTIIWRNRRIRVRKVDDFEYL